MGRLYVVEWSIDGLPWRIVRDQTDDGAVPAVFLEAGDAERRRKAMAEEFPGVRYRVVGYEHVGI